MYIKCSLLWILIIPWSAFGQWNDDVDPSPEAGSIAVEGGVFRVFGDDRRAIVDPIVIYLNTSFSIRKEFGLKEDIQFFRLGPKVGIGLGRAHGGEATSVFYDALFKARFQFPFFANRFQTYLDIGPGLTNYRNTSFELEAGGGVNFYLSAAFIGFNIQYKEIFGNDQLKRGLAFLGSLGYSF